MYENEPTAKRTVDDTEGQVERNITEVEEQEENALQALLATFGVNETNLGRVVHSKGQREYATFFVELSYCFVSKNHCFETFKMVHS